MQKLLFIILTTNVLLFIGCNIDSKLNKSDLESLIQDAISGDQDANIKLQGLLSTGHIGNTNYNQLFIDELDSGGKKYFSVILEYSDPRLNVVAIYDEDLNLYLLDQSLNGYLNSEWIVNDDRKFVFVQERFFTKDVLSVDRLSIYEVIMNTAKLVYRSLSRFVKDNNLAYQRVETITDGYLLTKISGTNENYLNNKIDTFYLNTNSKEYLSRNNLFENYVHQEVNNFIWINTKPQITEDFNSAEDDTTTNSYRISLDNEWQKNLNYVEDRRLKDPIKGVKYTSSNLRSSFTIVQVPKGEESEKYCPYILTETLKGEYQIRASAVFEIGENYLQIFEHTCGSTKYLLLFECPKSIYLENRKAFSDMINSFWIEC